VLYSYKHFFEDVSHENFEHIYFDQKMMEIDVVGYPF
jgi:hypothetical protein